MTGAPTVSVVIPCYNLGAYLDEAVQSVLTQTYRDFEIVVVDDGSTDPATRHLFTSYQRPSTRVLRTENRGLAEARNLGIREAAGRYVSFLDADDALEPTFLERTVAVLESEPDAAFASCWLTAFGGASFLWSPDRCDFPRLLAEDTVCTAALTRKEAVLAAGGFDPGMPVSGYEDWDLAIGMVERGLAGRIVPESLFRYRIRGGSMSESCTSLENHANLFRYIVEKHAGTYRSHLAGVLEEIEKRTAELETYRATPPPAERPDLERRVAFLEGALEAVLGSSTWKLSRPVRRLVDAAKPRARGGTGRSGRAPRISVVLTCRDGQEQLSAAFENVSLRTSRDDEIIVVDDGSTAPATLHLLEGLRAAGFPVLRTPGLGAAAAREAGLRVARAPIVFAVGTDDALDPGLVPGALELLQRDRSLAFVLGGLGGAAGGAFTWIPDSPDLPGALSCPHVAFPFVRRDALRAVGGYDATLPSTEHADCDLVIRLAAAGHRGGLLRTAAVARVPGPPSSLVASLFAKHAPHFEAHWKTAVLGREDQRRRLQAVAWDPFYTPAPEASRSELQWGDLRRLEPVSRVWGVDRGLPIDRYYIARFLDRHRGDIRGAVLEVKDSGYTAAYGTAVERSDVVDIAADNPSATLVADLSARDSLPENVYDCFVLTQTIHIIYDTRGVLRNACRALRPGGVLLATVPCVSRLDYESGLDGDYWRFTPASAKRLFEEAFGEGSVEIEVHGNVLACSAFLQGVAAEELTPAELDRSDPYFPLLLCIRAKKAVEAVEKESPTARLRPGAEGNANALVLLYHRIDRPRRDRWGLCVSPGNFRSQMEHLAERFRPVRLRDLDGSAGEGLPTRAVAVTFDDGYRDNLMEAVPTMRRLGVPATFFVSGEGAFARETFWWEVLDAAMAAGRIGEGEAHEMHSRFRSATPEERERMLDALPRVTGPFPRPMTRDEILSLSREGPFEIGGHGWSHRDLGTLPAEEQASEIERNLDDLAALTGTEIASFAYPFGGPFSSETVVILRRCGIRLACAVADQPVTPETDRFALPRVEVGDWSGEELVRRLERVLESAAPASGGEGRWATP